MLPGPDLIYKCPQCGQLISGDNLMSGNTFGVEMEAEREEKNINIIETIEQELLEAQLFKKKLEQRRTMLNQKEAVYFQKRGELKEKSGDYQGALEDYEKAIMIDDKNPIFYVLKAGACEN